MKHFWKDGFSINEAKVSVMVILLIIAFTYVLYADAVNGYIFTDKVFNVVKWLIAAVAGVNGVQALTGLSDSNDNYYDEDMM